MRKFELFMGCLGNGITCCNKAVEEHGDYKKIAHISSRGNIKFYVSENYVPQNALTTIIENARLEREKFLEYWTALTTMKQYEILLDELSYSITKDYMRNKAMSLEEKVANLTSYYMTQH